MTFKAVGCSLVCFAALGCGGSADDGSAVRSAAMEATPRDDGTPAIRTEATDTQPEEVAFHPLDLSTAVFDSSPTVSFPHPYPEADTVARDALARSFELITWPERELVTTTNVFLEGAPEDRDPLRVLFVPSVPLEDRWYALRSTTWRGSIAGAVRDGDGHWVSRFRVGHQPIVQVARVIVDDGGNPEIRLTYSERIRADHDNVWRVSVDDDAVNCELVNAGELTSHRGTNVVRIACPPFRGGSRVQLRAGLPVATAVGGHPAVDVDGGELRGIDLVFEMPPASPESPDRGLGSALPSVREAARAVSRFGLEPG